MSDTGRRQAGQDEAVRRRELARLLPLWPNEVADHSIGTQRRICHLMASALRRERQRGVGGHWGYDVSRHAALARMLPVELRRLDVMEKRRTVALRRSGGAQAVSAAAR